ncbi:hypothetical protein Cni_G29516 [Canna indica]|uniref:Uncharacterized protein n=1 Tax=Canna indica TaxID=4628 RepID=A0AAQ3L5L4_9LILI|nr:hypothetical protein Cni_G29516 [Canna indica]
MGVLGSALTDMVFLLTNSVVIQVALLGNMDWSRPLLQRTFQANEDWDAFFMIFLKEQNARLDARRFRPFLERVLQILQEQQRD